MDFLQNLPIHKKSTIRDYPFLMSTKNYPTQIRHNPHPFLVRNIKGFLGLPMAMVETEDDETMAAKRTVEYYIKDCIKRGNWNYKDGTNDYVKKTKDLDSVLALQYFTGLQSYSFRENYLPYLGYREYFIDWRRQLRNLTEAAYQPYIALSKSSIEVTPEIQNPNEWLNDQKLQKRSKSMYSESGRLKTNESRVSTGSSNRPRTTQIKPKLIVEPNLNELDAKVFMLLADLLQTQSVCIIQNWLSRSTERERAIITSMLQAAISKPPLEITVEIPSRKIKTSEREKTPNQNINESRPKTTSSKTEENNILIIDSTETETQNLSDIRPPTSSTFKRTKDNTENSQVDKQGRNSKSSMWNQSVSIIKGDEM